MRLHSLFYSGSKNVYRKRSFIFDQFVGGFGVTMEVFLLKLTVSIFWVDLRESEDETGAWAKAHIASERIATDARTVFFIIVLRLWETSTDSTVI
jgi:hypothetical protein